jgi:hypothetical protein
MFTFRPRRLEEVKGECLVTLDTNALLLPYKTDSRSLTDIRKAYETLAKEARLKVPAQAVREYLQRQPDHIGSVVSAVKRALDALGQAAPPKYPLLQDLKEHKELVLAWDKIQEEYRSRLKDLYEHVRGWYGNDPVSDLYTVFTEDMVVEHEGDQQQLLSEMEFRVRHEVPPGYKDAGKPDLGIGDFLIWQSILRMGREQKKHLVFVSGEKKADWCYKSEGNVLFPRLELADEYRRASGGQSFYIIPLSELISWFDPAPETIKELKKAEDQQRKDAELRAELTNDPALQVVPRFTRPEDAELYARLTNLIARSEPWPRPAPPAGWKWHRGYLVPEKIGHMAPLSPEFDKYLAPRWRLRMKYTRSRLDRELSTPTSQDASNQPPQRLPDEGD